MRASDFSESPQSLRLSILKWESCTRMPRTVGRSPSEISAAPAALKKLDKNSDGKLTLEEFLGKRTGELHQALASSPENPEFAPQRFDSFYLNGEYHGLTGLARGQLSDAAEVPVDLALVAHHLGKHRGGQRGHADEDQQRHEAAEEDEEAHKPVHGPTSVGGRRGTR